MIITAGQQNYHDDLPPVHDKPRQPAATPEELNELYYDDDAIMPLMPRKPSPYRLYRIASIARTKPILVLVTLLFRC